MKIVSPEYSNICYREEEKMKRETNVGRCRIKDVKDDMIWGYDDQGTLAHLAFGQRLKAGFRDISCELRS